MILQLKYAHVGIRDHTVHTQSVRVHYKGPFHKAVLSLIHNLQAQISIV